MTSATNERQLRRQQEDAARDVLVNKTVITSLMSHRDGRRWVWNLLSRCGCFRSSFDPSAGGHSRMCFAEGQRTIGLELLGYVTAFTPTHYITMTNENSPQKIKELDDDGSGADSPADD